MIGEQRPLAIGHRRAERSEAGGDARPQVGDLGRGDADAVAQLHRAIEIGRDGARALVGRRRPPSSGGAGDARAARAPRGRAPAADRAPPDRDRSRARTARAGSPDSPPVIDHAHRRATRRAPRDQLGDEPALAGAGGARITSAVSRRSAAIARWNHASSSASCTRAADELAAPLEPRAIALVEAARADDLDHAAAAADPLRRRHLAQLVEPARHAARRRRRTAADRAHASRASARASSIASRGCGRREPPPNARRRRAAVRGRDTGARADPQRGPACRSLPPRRASSPPRRAPSPSRSRRRPRRRPRGRTRRAAQASSSSQHDTAALIRELAEAARDRPQQVAVAHRRAAPRRRPCVGVREQRRSASAPRSSSIGSSIERRIVDGTSCVILDLEIVEARGLADGGAANPNCVARRRRTAAHSGSCPRGTNRSYWRPAAPRPRSRSAAARLVRSCASSASCSLPTPAAVVSTPHFWAGRVADVVTSISNPLGGGRVAVGSPSGPSGIAVLMLAVGSRLYGS